MRHLDDARRPRLGEHQSLRRGDFAVRSTTMVSGSDDWLPLCGVRSQDDIVLCGGAKVSGV